MKIVVIGGTGLIGSQVVNILRQNGHEVIAASPASGVDTLTGAGLAEALAGAEVVVELVNSPSFEDEAVMKFFKTSTGNLLAAEKTAGVRHHVALSIVGLERLPSSGYFRAKLAQEALIKASPVPWTIVRSTQFFQFARGIIDDAAKAGEIRLSTGMMQPIAAADVAAVVADAALAEPVNGTVEIAGPEPIRMSDFGKQYMDAHGDKRPVTPDPEAKYFGAKVDDTALRPETGHPRLGKTTYADWLRDDVAHPR